jgi:hypothetical protein
MLDGRVVEEADGRDLDASLLVGAMGGNHV